MCAAPCPGFGWREVWSRSPGMGSGGRSRETLNRQDTKMSLLLRRRHAGAFMVSETLVPWCLGGSVPHCFCRSIPLGRAQREEHAVGPSFLDAAGVGGARIEASAVGAEARELRTD